MFFFVWFGNQVELPFGYVEFHRSGVLLYYRCQSTVTNEDLVQNEVWLKM